MTIKQLHDVLPETDVLVLCLPLTPETEGLIGRNEIALMPQGSIIVNVARGKILDTDALVAALESGHVFAAGLDVTDPEPLPDGHRLWDFDNVLITSQARTRTNTAISNSYAESRPTFAGFLMVTASKGS